MSTLVYMKLLEQTPAKYDRGMRVITLGRVDRIKREIAAGWVEPGTRNSVGNSPIAACRRS